MQVLMEYVVGKFGKSICLSAVNEEGNGSGLRICGGDASGTTVAKFSLSENQIESLIKEAKFCLKELKKYNKRNKNAK
jgi:hypothetical protein